MGILSNLFKPKSAKSKSDSPEGRPTFAVSSFLKRPRDPEPTPVEAADAQPPPETATDDTPQKSISWGGFKRNVTEKAAQHYQEVQKNIAPTPAPATSPDIKSHTLTIVPVKAAAISDKQITIDIDEVVAQIPAQFLKPGPRATAKKALLFNTYELLPGLSQGKATVPVSRIAELAPELFNGQSPADAQVELPLQKIVAQIGKFPGRPDQVQEIYPPLDSRYAKLVLEKGVPAPAAPVAQPAPPQPPAEIEMAEAVVETAAAVEVPAAPVEKAAAAEAPVIAPKVEPELAIQPVQTVEVPVLDEKPAAVEAGTNGSAASQPEELPAIETVSYSLASIFPNVPESWHVGDLKSVDHAARITVPFDLVEVQLASGKVELAFADFFQALPENLKGHFSGNKEEGRTARVLIPLNEVFQNLPGVEPLPPPARPLHLEPEDEIETGHIPEIEVPEAETPTEVAALAEPAAIEAEKPEPVVAETHEIVVEEQKPPEEAILPVAAEPVIEPEPAKVEPAAQIEPQPAATPAPEPVPEFAPQPPRVAFVPPPITAYVEQPDPNAPFITPKIHIQRMAPPALLPTNDVSIPSPETPRHEQTETKQPPAPSETDAPVEAAAPSETATGLHPVIKNLLVSDGKLDTRKTVEHVTLLPGIKAAALIIKGKTKSAGDIPENFHVQDLGKAASVLFQSLETHAPKGPAGAARFITLHHDQTSTTWFKQDGVLLCVLHAQRSLEAEPHTALLIVMQEIVRLRQH